MREKDFSKIQTKNKICINVFSHENKLVFPIYFSNQKFKNSMDLLLVTNENKLHYVHIKDFDRFMLHKARNKYKKYFCKSCLQCFSSKNVLEEHKKFCLNINGAQSIRLEVAFKIHVDFECNLSSVESYEGSYSKKISRSHSS